MALIVDGISPTAIEINGNSDINVLEVDGVAYWGKPFTLTINTDAYTSVVVTRTNSKNQHASLGTLETGSLIYYADFLEIEVSANDGYSVYSFTIDGKEYSEEKVSKFAYDSITINVTSSAQGKTWTTVWSGSNQYASGTSASSISKQKEHEMTVSNVDFSICDEIRITGTTFYGGKSFTSAMQYGEQITIVDGNVDQYIEINSANIIKISTYGKLISGMMYSWRGVIIEKVEVYK